MTDFSRIGYNYEMEEKGVAKTWTQLSNEAWQKRLMELEDY